MIRDWGALFGIADESLTIFILLFTRISASVFLLPAFGEQAVPTRIKLVVSIGLSLLIFSSQLFATAPTPSIVSTPILIPIEAANGLLIGFWFRCLVFILQICGTIAAQSVSLAQSFGAGLGVDPQPAFSTLLVVGALALLATTGWHLQIVHFYLYSFELLPVGELPIAAETADLGVKQIGWTFALGFTLAAPFLALSLIYNLGLGFINKAMPQLMVAMVGAPAASFLGLALLFAASPLILIFWKDELLLDALRFGVSFNE